VATSGSRCARLADELILDPDEFYILVSKEAVQVPPDYAAEMVPFDPLVGEFRVHYAGFFDPGFGHAAPAGAAARAVLEVRSREVPFILEHGQIVGRLVYERMAERPDRSTAGHRLQLPGAGPEAVEALPGFGHGVNRGGGAATCEFARCGASQVRAGRRDPGGAMPRTAFSARAAATLLYRRLAGRPPAAGVVQW
jgi:hypothetical protein